MNWRKERYVRWYVKPPAAWLALPVLTRGFGAELLRAAYPTGEIECGHLEPAAAVALVVTGNAAEIAPHLGALLSNGYVVDIAAAGNRGRRLVIPNYFEAQGEPKSGAQRTADWRANDPSGRANDPKGAFCTTARSPDGDLGDASVQSTQEGELPSESQTSDGCDETPTIHPSIPSIHPDHAQAEIVPIQVAKKPRRERAPNSPFSCFLSEKWSQIEDPVGFEERLREAFPAVDLLAEARKAWLWEGDRGRRRWKNPRAGLRNWMGNARPNAAPANARREVVGFDKATGKPVYREG